MKLRKPRKHRQFEGSGASELRSLQMDRGMLDGIPLKRGSPRAGTDRPEIAHAAPPERPLPVPMFLGSAPIWRCWRRRAQWHLRGPGLGWSELLPLGLCVGSSQMKGQAGFLTRPRLSQGHQCEKKASRGRGFTVVRRNATASGTTHHCRMCAGRVHFARSWLRRCVGVCYCMCSARPT
jgi:hypothetical protein